MAHNLDDNKQPTPKRECAYCDQMDYTNEQFLNEYICYECRTEIKKYFKKLCQSKSEFREHKAHK